MHDLKDANKKGYTENLKASRLFLDSHPLGAVVLLTSRCNISCIMCGWWKDKAEELPYEAVKKLFDIMPYLEMINWQGGEPFMVSYFKELYQEISASFPHIKQSISTNGLLIDEEWAQILASSFLDITFSIDAVEKDKYEYIRRGGDFNILISNIEQLNKKISEAANKNIWKTLFVVLMKSNYRDLSLFLEFAEKYGFAHLQFAQESGNLPEEQLFIPPDEEAISYIKKELRRIEPIASEKEIVISHPFDLYEKENGNSVPEKGICENIPFCSLPWYKLTVLPNGDVKPDCVCERIAGNIITDDVMSIWNNSIMQEYRERIRSGDIEGFCAEICNSGEYLGFRLNVDEKKD